MNGVQTAPTRRTLLHDEQGANLVEMALSCSIFLMILIGLFQTTLAVYAYHYVSEAAREATRYAIVRGKACTGLSGCGADNSQIQSFVRGLGYPGITTTNLSTVTTWYTITMDPNPTPPTAIITSCGTDPAGCNLPGNQVRVQVKYDFPLNIPFVPSATLHMSSNSAMVISQ